jgi:hypothetical protein
VGDLVPQFNVRWNNGVHNYMTYITGNLTVGRYDPARLANLGIGHNALDGGFGYTYLNPLTGNEFSAVLGFTYNFENTNTQYQNGVDMHLDWGTSHFFTKQLLAGVVGYAYQQVSCDNGPRDRLGCFESRVFGIGPQVSYIIPMGQLQGYLNLKGYREFDAAARPSGWNAWLTFSISPAAATPPKPTRPMLTKKGRPSKRQVAAHMRLERGDLVRSERAQSRSTCKPDVIKKEQQARHGEGEPGERGGAAFGRSSSVATVVAASSIRNC